MVRRERARRPCWSRSSAAPPPGRCRCSPALLRISPSTTWWNGSSRPACAPSGSDTRRGCSSRFSSTPSKRGFASMSRDASPRTSCATPCACAMPLANSGRSAVRGGSPNRGRWNARRALSSPRRASGKIGRRRTCSNAARYGGALRSHPAVAKHAIDEAPLEVIDTAGRGFEEETPEASESKANEGEAALAAAEVERLLEKGLAPADIAVIAPYDAQVQRLRQMLPARVDQGLEVDTVDGFQGREKEAVVVTLVRSNKDGEVGFLADIRRMNVALTRARKKLVVIGDSATVSRHPFYEGFFRDAEKQAAGRSAWDRC